MSVPSPGTTGVGVTAPSGTITFKDNGVAIGSGTVTLPNNQATLTLNALAVGTTHAITAEYSGDGNYLASTSTSPLNQAATRRIRARL